MRTKTTPTDRQRAARGLLLGALAAAAVLPSGCATGTTALWRAGVQREGDPRAPMPFPRKADDVAVFLKEEFGVLEETESRREWLCGSTTVLRKAFLLGEGAQPRLERDHEVLGWITTEEFPRDERTSEIHGNHVSTIFGIGTTWEELFDVRLDPAWREDALRRLREHAARLGADAVIDVYATGEAEHHMWLGTSLGFDSTRPDSPIFCSAELLDLRLRDVRLHGTAVRYED
jgi:hypothetical protein